MTTGQDESGPQGPNLLAGVPGGPAAPGGDPAAAERLLAAVLDIGERLAALETAASSERSAPVTREELEAWGEGLLEKVAKTVPNESGAGGAIMAHAARMEAAAERIDTGLERTAERFAAEVSGMEKWLAEDRSAIRAGTSGIEGAASRIEASLGEFRKRAESRFNDIASVAWDTREMVRELKFNWRIFLAPWAIFAFFIGSIFGTGIELTNRLLP